VNPDRLQFLQLVGGFTERVIRREPPLVHGRDCGRRKADHVTDREDVRNRSAVLPIHGDPPAPVGGEGAFSGSSSSVTP
jgi:hypothetical protein